VGGEGYCLASHQSRSFGGATGALLRTWRMNPDTRAPRSGLLRGASRDRCGSYSSAMKRSATNAPMRMTTAASSMPRTDADALPQSGPRCRLSPGRGHSGEGRTGPFPYPSVRPSVAQAIADARQHHDPIVLDTSLENDRRAAWREKRQRRPSDRRAAHRWHPLSARARDVDA
jgi:hypothetical protein